MLGKGIGIINPALVINLALGYLLTLNWLELQFAEDLLLEDLMMALRLRFQDYAQMEHLMLALSYTVPVLA